MTVNQSALMSARMLIGTLLGDRPRTWEMGENFVMPDDITEFRDESCTLNAILEVEKLGQAPTYEAVGMMLHGMSLHDVADRLDQYREHACDYPNALPAIAFNLTTLYVLEKRGEKIRDEVAAVMAMPIPPHEKLERAQKLVEAAQPRWNNKKNYRGVELVDLIGAEAMKLLARQRRGGTMGPGWGYQGLRAATPYMKTGNMYMLMGKGGSGKTTVLANLMLKWQSDGFDPYVFLYETSPAQLYHKLVAIKGKVPVSFFEGDWDPENTEDPRNTIINNITDQLHLGSQITLRNAARDTLTDIEQQMRAALRVSAVQGREPVFAIDYYQLIKHGGRDIFGGTFNYFADELKALAVDLDVFLFVIAQEQEGQKPGDFTTNIRPKGGDNIYKGSQFVMRVTRTPRLNTEHAQTRDDPDAFGGTRYVVHPDDALSPQGRLDVVKNNFGPLKSARVEFEHGIATVHCRGVGTVDLQPDTELFG